MNSWGARLSELEIKVCALAFDEMSTRARCFFTSFNRLEFYAPLVETSSGHPELPGQLIDALAGTHALYGHALGLPGISLLLTIRVSSPGECAHRRVCQCKGAFHSQEPRKVN